MLPAPDANERRYDSPHFCRNLAASPALRELIGGASASHDTPLPQRNDLDRTAILWQRQRQRMASRHAPAPTSADLDAELSPSDAAPTHHSERVCKQYTMR